MHANGRPVQALQDPDFLFSTPAGAAMTSLTVEGSIKMDQNKINFQILGYFLRLMAALILVISNLRLKFVTKWIFD